MTSTTPRNSLREPGTAAGKTYVGGSYAEMRHLMGDKPYSTLDVVLAIEEQAATEARRERERELLATFRAVEHEIDFLSGTKPVVQADKFEAWLKRTIASLESGR